jgi:hypothetical protein
MSNWSPLSVSKIWEYFKLQAEISGEPVGCSGNEAAVIKLRGLQRLNRIALYLAIGGSFEPAPELPTLPKVERHILAPMLFLTRVSVTMSHHLIVLPDDISKPILDAVNGKGIDSAAMDCCISGRSFWSSPAPNDH